MATVYSIEVFKTNVDHEDQATEVLAHLSLIYPKCKINFDLEDCDRILRVAGFNITSDHISKCLNAKGYFCEQLS